MRKTHSILTTLAAFAALLATAAAIAGCGGNSDTSAPAATGKVDGSAFPVRIEQQYGTTEIPAPPKRIVTVGYVEPDTLLALGVKPVGEREFLGGYDYKERPWAQKDLAGYEAQVVGGEQIDFEKVAALEPDLIIGIDSGMTEAEYKRLSAIAPTLAQSDKYIEFGVPWQAQTLVIGEALGREAQARTLVDSVEAELAKARAEHPEFAGKTFTLAYTEGAFGAYASGDTRSVFFEDLGFKLSPKIDKLAGKSFYVNLDEEQFRLIDSDVIVDFGKPSDVEGNPVLSRLDAAKEGRIIYLDLGDQFAGALGYSSPLSIPFLLKEAVPRLEAALDGDPATDVAPPQ